MNELVYTNLDTNIYMIQPTSFRNNKSKRPFIRLRRLYTVSKRVFDYYNFFKKVLKSLGYIVFKLDNELFTYYKKNKQNKTMELAILLCHADDNIILSPFDITFKLLYQ